MGDVGEVLKRKVGPAPVWVYLVIGILGLAYYIKKRQQANNVPGQANPSAASIDPGVFPNAYPMNYSSDIYTNSTQQTSGGQFNQLAPQFAQASVVQIPAIGGISWYQLAQQLFPSGNQAFWTNEATWLQSYNGGGSAPQPNQAIKIAATS